MNTKITCTCFFRSNAFLKSTAVLRKFFPIFIIFIICTIYSSNFIIQGHFLCLVYLCLCLGRIYVIFLSLSQQILVIKRNTAQKMKFSIKDFFSKCDQIRKKLRIWSHLLKKSIKENFIFCALKP